MSLKANIKKRLILYLGILTAIIMSSFFWGLPGQTINMRRASKDLAVVRKKLEGDARFSELKMGVSTADLGRRIWVHGTVPDRESRQHLKALMIENISDRFRVFYYVSIRDASVPPDGDGT